MLNKKQYIIVMITASIAFVAIFLFSYIFTVTHIEPIVPEEQVEQQQEEQEQEVAEAGSDTNPVTILPSTNVKMRIVDQYDKVVSEKAIETKSLLGYDEKTISQMFRGYKVIQFDHREVVLEKVQYIETKPKEYRLGIESGEIGIITQDEPDLFLNLGLSAKEFSKQTNMMIINGLVSITPSQKETLERDPDYIEYILQNFSE